MTLVNIQSHLTLTAIKNMTTLIHDTLLSNSNFWVFFWSCFWISLSFLKVPCYSNFNLQMFSSNNMCLKKCQKSFLCINTHFWKLSLSDVTKGTRPGYQRHPMWLWDLPNSWKIPKVAVCTRWVNSREAANRGLILLLMVFLKIYSFLGAWSIIKHCSTGIKKTGWYGTF